LRREVFFFRPLARKLAFQPLEGVHVWVWVLVGVVVVDHAVDRERDGGWLAVRGGARTVMGGGGREGAGGRHGGPTYVTVLDWPST